MKSLHGLYRISFDVQVDQSDQLDVSDITQALTEGFGEGLLETVSHLKIESIEKHGTVEPKVFKVGDKVQLKDSLKLQASIYEDDGYFFVGAPSEISNEIGIQEIMVEAGSIGFVNKIDGSNLEIVDLDCVASVPFENYEEIASIDSILVNAEQLEKIDSDEVK